LEFHLPAVIDEVVGMVLIIVGIQWTDAAEECMLIETAVEEVRGCINLCAEYTKTASQSGEAPVKSIGSLVFVEVSGEIGHPEKFYKGLKRERVASVTRADTGLTPPTRGSSNGEKVKAGNLVRWASRCGYLAESPKE
jgi:hypothetical protein